MSTRLGTDDEGRPVVRKSGSLRAAAREAALLAEAAHPGVVAVASASDGEVVLRWAGTRTLAGQRLPVDDAAAVVGALAATVADLHAVGVRHGAIRPDHVVVGADGLPVLCGFGAAGRAGEPGAPEEADDVAALGRLLRTLAGAETELEPIPERRLGRRSTGAGPTRAVLLTLADQATDDDPARRPTARRLADALASAQPAPSSPPRPGARRSRPRFPVQGSTEPVDPSTADAPPRRTIEPRRPAAAAPRRSVPAVPWRLVAGAVGVGLVATGLSSVLGGPDTSRATPPPSTAAGEAIAVLECPPAPPPAADPDGDGCPSTAAVDGGVVVVDGTRYGVGQPGDALAVGDWDCDGAATVAAVRPRTGEVFVFEGWASDGADLVVPAATLVPGAVRPEPGDDRACPGLVVVDAAGRRTEVRA